MPAQSQSQRRDSLSLSDGGVEVDYGPDSGMDDAELAAHYPPMHDGAVYMPYIGGQEPYPEHAHTPPPYLPQLEGVLGAGYDYNHLGIQQVVPPDYWAPVSDEEFI